MTTGAWARLRQRFGAPPRAQSPAALSLAQARAAIRDGQSGRALDLLLQASASTPHDADAWSLLGWVYHDLGNDGEARAATGRALAIDPDHLEALNTMGVMAGELADPMVSSSTSSAHLPPHPTTRRHATTWRNAFFSRATIGAPSRSSARAMSRTMAATIHSRRYRYGRARRLAANTSSSGATGGGSATTCSSRAMCRSCARMPARHA